MKNILGEVFCKPEWKRILLQYVVASSAFIQFTETSGFIIWIQWDGLAVLRILRVWDKYFAFRLIIIWVVAANELSLVVEKNR